MHDAFEVLFLGVDVVVRSRVPQRAALTALLLVQLEEARAQRQSPAEREGLAEERHVVVLVGSATALASALAAHFLGEVAHAAAVQHSVHSSHVHALPHEEGREGAPVLLLLLASLQLALLEALAQQRLTTCPRRSRKWGRRCRWSGTFLPSARRTR